MTSELIDCVVGTRQIQYIVERSIGVETDVEGDTHRLLVVVKHAICVAAM